jgi:predicted small lipoprotein YifL
VTFAAIVKLAGMASLLSLAALGLSGCGRRGDLEVPTAAATPRSGRTSAAGDAGSLTGTRTKTTTKPVAPKQSFVLDPLL